MSFFERIARIGLQFLCPLFTDGLPLVFEPLRVYVEIIIGSIPVKNDHGLNLVRNVLSTKILALMAFNETFDRSQGVK